MPQPHRPNELVSFDHIPSPNFGVVNCIIRDDRGFLWFGTSKGLCKFDGYQVRVLAIGAGAPPAANVAGHDPQVVNTVTRMNDGSFLLGTGLGLWKFDPVSEQFDRLSPDPGLSDEIVTCAARDSIGALWIGTAGGGLYRFDEQHLTAQRCTAVSPVQDASVTSLLVDRAGEIWEGTSDGGLALLDSSGGVRQRYAASGPAWGKLSSDHILSLSESTDDRLWIGTDNGVDILDRKSSRIRSLNLPSPMSHAVRSIARDPSGRMWVGASELGMFSFSEGALSQFSTQRDGDRSLNSIRVLYPDPAASDGGRLLLWVGTRTGLDKLLLSRNPFSNFIRSVDAFQVNRGAVLSLCEDHTGIVWAGLWGGGLNGWRRVNGNYLREPGCAFGTTSSPALPDNDVSAVMEDSRRRLWIGTSNGLAMLDSARRRIVIDRHRDGDSASIAGDGILKIFEDRAGEIWICTRKGLSRLIAEKGEGRLPGFGSPHRFRTYLGLPADTHPYGGSVVSDLFEDRSGELWAATYGRGLNRLGPDGPVARYLDPLDSASDKENFVYSITENREGLFWLSTRIGLVSFDPRSGAFTRYPVQELVNTHIFDIIADDAGVLWLSTSIGLGRFDPQSGAFERFSGEQGLQFSELFSGFYRSGRGTLLVGGIDGFAEFSLEDLSIGSRPPAIAITSLKALDKEYSARLFPPAELLLSYDQNVLSFSFAALDYTEPSRNRFRYRLSGIDPVWVDAGTRNYAAYPNLLPGSYLFEVKGCNSDNVWNETGLSVPITITPPYWQTIWFRTLMGVILAGAVYAAYRYRLRRLLEVERLRLRIADDLHDDVGSNLGAIAMVSRELQRAPGLDDQMRGKLAEIFDTAITTSEGMKDIVWFIKPKGDRLDDLLFRMKSTAPALLGETHYTFQASPEHDSSRISIDFKKNFFLAFKEILTNVARHANASEVEIRVARKDAVLEMTVRDNGRGFDERNGRRGNGLASLRNRAASLRGICEITSVPARGTTVRFSGTL